MFTGSILCGDGWSWSSSSFFYYTHLQNFVADDAGMMMLITLLLLFCALSVRFILISSGFLLEDDEDE